uniref:SH3 domain-containing protein n=1 Tax=Meloidogyne javanica TaxID=6303 RepID=A0A915LD35_MELJA
MRGGPNAGDYQHLSSAFLKTLLNTRPNSSLFRAAFQYLPIRDSPNENPHVELALQLGELVLVHGPMDEDCFYWGETLDNRAGLVPSNFVQRVCSNNQICAVVPGSFKCRALLEDLDLDKFVNVSVRSVTSDGLTSPDAACTLAVGSVGLPDPPLEVRAENGPQPGTLLVSWKPNSSQPRPPSRAAVQSYLVYADGRCIAEIPGSTADHVLLRLSDFADDPPMFITVRTKTKEGNVSADSKVVRVPRSGNGTTNEREGVVIMQNNSSLPYYSSGEIIGEFDSF